MANVVYNYPKTSCMCCEVPAQLPRAGMPSNMSVDNCDFSPYEYTNIHEFRSDIEPAYKDGYNLLNPQAMSMDSASDFQKISCKNNTSGCNTVYASLDPRLFNVPHTQYLTLDRPPTDSSIPLSTVNTDKSLNNYGQNYSGYSDINAGQIVYYIDKSIEDPFYSPLYTIPSQTTGYVFKDPMDAYKPMYERTPLVSRDPLNTKHANYPGCLSWIADSTAHREDLLSKQMWKQNQQKYSARWH